MAGAHGIAAAANSILNIMPKLTNDDPDLRYMGLNDLSLVLSSAPVNIFAGDASVAPRVGEALIKCLQDGNGEVQNMAITCVASFVNRISEPVLCNFIDKIASLPADSVVDTSIPALALRQVVVSLPHPTLDSPRTQQIFTAYAAISKVMIPRLSGCGLSSSRQAANKQSFFSILETDLENGTDSNAIDVLIELVNAFGPMLRETEVANLIKVSLKVIRSESANPVLKKKTVTAIYALAPYLSDKHLNSFIEQLFESLSSDSLLKSQKRIYLNLLASMARAIPDRFSTYIASLVPYVLGSLSQQEIDADLAHMEETEERDPEVDETREAALLALEAWMAFCTAPMRPYTAQVIDIAQRFLKYDPNLAEEDDDFMEDEDDPLEGDDFEEDLGGDDEDDSSWKVRRCAAKIAHVLINTRSDGDLLDDGTLYSAIAPALISRFREREETVRLEILQALSKLIRITGGEAFSARLIDGVTNNGTMAPPPSRKRRRLGSDASMIDVSANDSLAPGHTDASGPPSGSAFSSLQSLGPQIVHGISQLMQTHPIATKESSIVVLKDLVISLHGRLSNYLPKTIPSIISAITQTNTLSTATMGASNAHRVEALTFLGAVAEVQSSKDLEPYVPQILPVIISAIHDKYTKVSTAALLCLQNLVFSLTPPRSSDTWVKPCLDEIAKAYSEVVSSNDADLEARRLAVTGLGLLLGHSSLGANYMTDAVREDGMTLLLHRLSNETMRLATFRAINTLGNLAKNSSNYPEGWVLAVADILVDQFRKVSRSIRSASVSALQTLTDNPASASQFTRESMTIYLPSLEPLLHGSDFHLIRPSLLILNAFVNRFPSHDGFQKFTSSLSQLLTLNLPKTTLAALIIVVRSFGSNHIGQQLMTSLLREASMNATPEVIGKAVGNLLVSGGETVGVKIESFIDELNGQQDVKKKCLALSVLGETTFLLQEESKLDPKFFIKRLRSDSSLIVGQAAATALGRAGAGSISTYVPLILNEIKNTTSAKDKQLFLLSIREIVNSEDYTALAPYVQELWNQVMSASQIEGAKTVGAESIGHLAIVEPDEFFPQLQNILTTSENNSTLRNLVLSALRVTVTSDSKLAHAGSVSNALLPLIKTLLVIVLRESDLENRRLALTVINAVGNSRVDDILAPLLPEIMEIILNECKIRQDLIREVQMGPFKHKVDDGLEIRKAAYECLYTIFSSPLFAASYLDQLIPPVISGVSDDNEVRLLSLLSLSKAIEVYPVQLQPLLPQFIEPFRIALKTKPRESAVKQEIERLDESMRSIIRFALDVNRKYPEGVAVSWTEWWVTVRIELPALVKQVEEEMKEIR